MPGHDDLPEYLDGALDEARRMALEEAMEQNATLCEAMLRQRRLERALHAMLAGEARQERLRDSVHAAIHGMPMERLRGAVLAHTSGTGSSVTERFAGWWRELGAGPRWAVAAAALVAVLALATVIWLGDKSADEAQFAGNAAGTEVQRDGSRMPATPGLALRVGDEIHVGANAATLQFDGGATTVVLDPDTFMVVRSITPRKEFQLAQGAVQAEVAPQRRGAMVWVTDSAEARVLGTRFALMSDGVFTRLDVAKGSVELQRRGAAEQTLVRAGEFAAADSQRLLEAKSNQAEPVWNVPRRTTPGFIHTSFRSETGGMEMGVNVLLPPRYDDFPQRRYPVLYFLHGAGGDEHSEAARFGLLFRDAMARRDLPPFIAVFPNCGPGHTPPPWVMGGVLARDLTRFVDERYRTFPFRNTRVVCGIGQGGHRALMLAMMQGPLFGAAAVFDDPLHGGPPGFRLLLERTQSRWQPADRRVLLLHSRACIPADAGALGSFLRSLDVAVDTHPLDASSPQHTAYPGAVWNELRPWLASQWTPGRAR